MERTPENGARRVPDLLSDDRSPWMTTVAAAEYLGCTPGTLKTWRAAGAGPKYHGRHRFVRYHIADLDAFVLNGGSRTEPES
jgi:Helix-turn-helix domain